MMLNYWTYVCVTDLDACFEINIIDMYIKRAVSPVYRFNGINVINLNIQQMRPPRPRTGGTSELFILEKATKI
jgi:hypothetical protein